MSKRTVRFRVIRGSNLIASDAISKTSDPYVKIIIGGKEVKTKYIKDNLNPVWDEVLTLDLPAKDDKANILVFDHDTFTKDDEIGLVDINFGSLELLSGVEKVFHLNLKLENNSAGTLEIGITPYGFGTTLKDQEDKHRKHLLESQKEMKEQAHQSYQTKQSQVQQQLAQQNNQLQDLQRKQEELEKQLEEVKQLQRELKQKQEQLSQEETNLNKQHELNQQQEQQKQLDQEKQLQELQKSLKPIYRYWNTSKHDHSYSINVSEAGSEKDGYISEGPAFHIAPTSVPGTIPVYSYFNSSKHDHLYTTKESEIGTTTKGQSAQGYTCEGILGYISAEPAVGTFPVYRYFNSSTHDHLYTTHAQELGSTISGSKANNGYTCEGILGYAYLTPGGKQ